jgi:SAM domain (Sterile alpha motif)
MICGTLRLDVMDIVVWLRSLGFGRYEAVFRENGIDEAVLSDLTEVHLRELGIPLGDRLKLLKAIAALGSPARPAEIPASKLTPVSDGPRPAQISPAVQPVGERRYLTVMFCDLVGSTGISAQLDAEEWRDLVSAYLDCASTAVTEMGGHVAKKLGDGLMALFGYPVAQETTLNAQHGPPFPSSGRSLRSTAKTPVPASRRSTRASASKPGRLWWMPRARFTGTHLTLRHVCRRWPKPARSWLLQGFSAKSLACS